MFWLIATARNAIIVVITGFIGYYFHLNDQDTFKMIGNIPAGLPPITPPPFSIPEVKNETTGEVLQQGESFFEMVSAMGSGVIVVPLIALLENMSICKAFGKFLRIISVVILSITLFLFNSQWKISGCNARINCNGNR